MDLTFKKVENLDVYCRLTTTGRRFGIPTEGRACEQRVTHCQEIFSFGCAE